MALKPHDDDMHANTGEANFNESMYFNFYDRRARWAASRASATAPTKATPR